MPAIPFEIVNDENLKTPDKPALPQAEKPKPAVTAGSTSSGTTPDPVTAVFQRMQPGICVGNFERDQDQTAVAELDADTGDDIMNARVSLTLFGEKNAVFVDRVMLKSHRTAPWSGGSGGVLGIRSGAAG